MNLLHQLSKDRKNHLARPAVWLIAGMMLWIAATALFLMACAVPASWVGPVKEPLRQSPPTVATAIVTAHGPPWTALPALPTPAGRTATTTVAPTFTPTTAPIALVPTPVPIKDEQSDVASGETSRPAAIVPPLQTGMLLDIQPIDSYGHTTIDDLSRKFYPETNFLPARYAVDRYQLHFQTINQYHELSTIRAELFVPHVDTPTEFPLFVYGAGTTGIGNACAPLDEITRGRNWGSYRTHMLSYAAQGYIAMLPLWQGYDDLGHTHPYFIAELEGPVMLDATRAVYHFFDTVTGVQAHPAAAVFLGGYSQGGHGAFAADAMAPAYASELPIKGIIGHASAPSVEALLRETPALSPYIVYAFHDYYGPEVIDPAQVFQEQWLPTFDSDASTKCVDDVYDYYQGGQATLYRSEFSQALYGGQLGFAFPYFQQALDRNDVGRRVNAQTPALLLHGSTDPIVTVQTNERFMREICQQGKPVTYYLYQNVHHFQTRQYSFVDTLNWMQAILAGTPVRADCATILAR